MVGYKISLSIERTEINVAHYAATNDDTQTCSPLSDQQQQEYFIKSLTARSRLEVCEENIFIS